MNHNVSKFLVPALLGAALATGVSSAQTTDATAPAAAPVAAPAVDAPVAAPAVDAPVAAPAVAAPAGSPVWMPAMQPGKGMVIIFRENKFVGSAVSMKVLADNGNAFPKLKNGRVIHAYLEPGDHTLYSDKKKQRDARILGVEAGQIYFFEARWETNMMRKADVDLVPVPFEEGIRRVSAFKHPYPG